MLSVAVCNFYYTKLPQCTYIVLSWCFLIYVLFLSIGQLLTWYCSDLVSSCNIYTVQQDTKSVLMSEFYSALMIARYVSDLIGPSSGVFCTSCIRRLWYVVIRVLLHTSSRYKVVWRTISTLLDSFAENGTSGWLRRIKSGLVKWKAFARISGIQTWYNTRIYWKVYDYWKWLYKVQGYEKLEIIKIRERTKSAKQTNDIIFMCIFMCVFWYPCCRGTRSGKQDASVSAYPYLCYPHGMP